MAKKTKPKQQVQLLDQAKEGLEKRNKERLEKMEASQRAYEESQKANQRLFSYFEAVCDLHGVDASEYQYNPGEGALVRLSEEQLEEIRKSEEGVDEAEEVEPVE